MWGHSSSVSVLSCNKNTQLSTAIRFQLRRAFTNRTIIRHGVEKARGNCLSRQILQPVKYLEDWSNPRRGSCGGCLNLRVAHVAFRGSLALTPVAVRVLQVLAKRGESVLARRGLGAEARPRHPEAMFVEVVAAAVGVVLLVAEVEKGSWRAACRARAGTSLHAGEVDARLLQRQGGLLLRGLRRSCLHRGGLRRGCLLGKRRGWLLGGGLRPRLVVPPEEVAGSCEARTRLSKVCLPSSALFQALFDKLVVELSTNLGRADQEVSIGKPQPAQLLAKEVSTVVVEPTDLGVAWSGLAEVSV